MIQNLHHYYINKKFESEKIAQTQFSPRQNILKYELLPHEFNIDVYN